MSQTYREADRDFQAGKIKLFIISDACPKDKYSGTNDDPFEIWTAECVSSSSFYPDQYSEEQRVITYNRHMRSKHEGSLTHTNGIKLPFAQ